jgi:imidazolonepropionase-like amidohydrolase
MTIFFASNPMAKNNLAILLVALVGIALPGLAQDRAGSEVSAGQPIYIRNVTLIDTKTGKESKGRTVVLSGERITTVKPDNKIRVPLGARVVDGAGKYLIPGLWDMHAHATDDVSTYPLYLANGVTGVREMSGPPDANRFRVELAAKKIDSPHMYIGSPIIDGPPPVWPDSIFVNTPDDARRVVDEQKRKGADFIKIYNSLSREAYFAIIDEGKRLRIPVEGHVPFAVSGWEATAAGQKSFEHLFGIPDACSTQEEKLRPKIAAAKRPIQRDRLYAQASLSYNDEKCRRLFASFKKNHTWQVPTLTIDRSVGWLRDPQFTNDDRLRYFSGEMLSWISAKDGVPPYMKDWTEADYSMERELFVYDQKLVGAMFRAGVPLLAGTDVANPYCFPGFSLHDELALMVESGATPLGALQSATWNPALFMDANQNYGSAEPGKVADLVLLEADPLENIRNTSRISAVFLAGKEFDRAALDQMLKKAAAARATPAK